MNDMIEGRELSKSYGNLAVLKSVDLSIGKGEILSITGPSGAGKSTLLDALCFGLYGRGFRNLKKERTSY